MPHDFELDHEHEHESSLLDAQNAKSIWDQDHIVFQTVGIDIGSSTSHLLFSRVHLRRHSHAMSSHFEVVRREVRWQSPIVFTPFKADSSIDAQELEQFIEGCFQSAGLKREDIDTGAVILTGEAIKKNNARAINQIFAQDAGRFVCATAGHQLEAMLAAHGSGACALSKSRAQCGLHIDIGGGTTKLALINQGLIQGVCAFAGGGRMVALDTQGQWTRLDDAARLLAQSLGVECTANSMAQEKTRRLMAKAYVGVLMDVLAACRALPSQLNQVDHAAQVTQISGLGALAHSLMLTPEFIGTAVPEYLTFSGGVSEYLFGAQTVDFGDISRLLVQEIIASFKQTLKLPIIEVAQRIRATVIGASQFTVQVSGNTIFLSDPTVLPAVNVPVVKVLLPGIEHLSEERVLQSIVAQARRLDLTPLSRMALAMVWDFEPDHATLFLVASAVFKYMHQVGERVEPLFLVIEGDVALSLGRVLRDELDFKGPLACIDGIELQEFDYIDMGSLITQTNVVPVVVKSLLF